MISDEALQKKIIEWLELRKNSKRLEREQRQNEPMKPAGTTEMFSSKGKNTPVGVMQRWNDLRNYKKSPKPNLPKSEVFKKEKEQKPIEDIVAGVKIPHEIQAHYYKTKEPIPREHKLRDMAAGVVSKIHSKNRQEGIRMSNKLLGIGEGGVATHPNAVEPEKRKGWTPPNIKTKQQYADVDRVKKQESPGMVVAPPLTHDERLDNPKNIAYENKNIKSIKKDKIYKK